jgi:hypothetical protein
VAWRMTVQLAAAAAAGEHSEGTADKGKQRRGRLVGIRMLGVRVARTWV